MPFGSLATIWCGIMLFLVKCWLPKWSWKFEFTWALSMLSGAVISKAMRNTISFFFIRGWFWIEYLNIFYEIQKNIFEKQLVNFENSFLIAGITRYTAFTGYWEGENQNVLGDFDLCDKNIRFVYKNWIFVYANIRTIGDFYISGWYLVLCSLTYGYRHSSGLPLLGKIGRRGQWKSGYLCLDQ